MRAVKRLEIITDAIELRLIVQVLEAHSLTGYTIVPAVEGRGEQGVGIAIATTHGATVPTFTTSVTPSTRSRMMRSMPAFSVTVLVGHVPQAPVSVTYTMPVASSTSRSTMSPPSAFRAGRITSIVSSTRVRMCRELS